MFAVQRVRGFAVAFTTLVALFALPSAAMAAQLVRAAPTASASVALLPTLQISAGPNSAVPLSIDPIAAPTQVVAPPAPRPLHDLVGAFVDYGDQDAEQLCLAKAVYFEARGETLEGQLAVAEVVLNRTASGIYPATICNVVTQPAQFSFIRGGRFPPVDTDSDCWHKALAIADIARKQLADEIPPNVLWYHASYVSPSWGRRLTRIARIGMHIFYG